MPKLPRHPDATSLARRLNALERRVTDLEHQLAQSDDPDDPSAIDPAD